MAMTTPLDGPRIEPRGVRAAALVVLLHGYGANGDDLIALGDGWRRSLPDAAFVAPNAPQTIPGVPGGLQWFPLTLRDPSEYWRGVAAAQPALDRFLDAELGRYRLTADRLVLVGFSQGSMMALHVGLRRALAPAGIVAYSGLLAGPERLAETKARPPVLLVHGETDDMIPAEALHMAREALAGAGIPVEWHVRPGLGHGIDAEAQWMAGHFIAQTLHGVRSGHHTA
jgi:phospholipase/carboxylesterase